MTRRWFNPGEPEKVQQLVDAVDAAEQKGTDASVERAGAIRDLLAVVGATEASRLLGISRQRIYQLANQAEEEAPA